MATSTFDRFRQYTGPTMVVLCGLLMFAFVVADPLMQWATQGQRVAANAGEVAVSWDGGKLTEQQLGVLVENRQVLANFLSQVFQVGREVANSEGNVNPAPLVALFDLPYRLEQNVEQDVVITKIYADAAREAGMVVSDETIRDYLSELGFRKVSTDEMRQMLKRYAGRGVTIPAIFDLLRDVMLARNYDQSFVYADATSLPEQRWRDWLRVNDQVIVEAAALRATDFLAEVDDPTDAELQAYYEEYKDAIPAPVFVNGVELPRPTPAFASPRRVVVQYAKLPIEKEVERLIGTVTEEQIAKFYEENKARYVKEESFFDDLEGLEEAGEESEEGMGGNPPSDADTDTAGDEQPAADSETSPEAEPAEDEADAAAPAGEEATTPADTPPAGQQGAIRPIGPFKLVSYQDGEEGGEAGPNTAASDDSDTEEPAAKETPSDETAADGAAADSMGDESGGEEGEEDDESEVEYQTLEEVREEIRETLAEAEAIEQIGGRMEEIIAPVQEAYDDYFIELVDAKALVETKPDTPMPEPPEAITSLKQRAEAAGLEFAETADLTFYEFRESAVGQTRDLSRPASGSGEPLPLWARLFGKPGVELFEPLLTYDVTFDSRRNPYPINGYLVIKTVDKPLRTPPLEEIKADVVRAWKLNRAADLALARAGEIVEEAQDEGLALKDFLAGQASITVSETDAFSWLTAGQFMPSARRVPIRLSQPEPIESAGPGLMEVVFGLEANRLGAALNHDHSVAYAVRVIQHMKSKSELQTDFLSFGQIQHQMYGFGQNYRNAAINARVGDLVGESPGDGDEGGGGLAIDWKRPPDTLRGDTDDDEKS